MLDTISKSLTIVTIVGTFLGFYFKAASSLQMEYIKTKYKNVPGESSIFKIILMMSGYIFVIIYIFVVIGLGVYFFEEKGNALSVDIKKLTSYNGIVFLLIILMYFNIIWTTHLFFKVRELYLRRLTSDKEAIIPKSLKIINILNTMLSALFFLVLSIDLFSRINDKLKGGTISGVNDIAQIVALCIFFASIFIIGLSINELCEILTKESKFLLKIGENTIECSCYLEYKEYYLIIKDSKETYIRKSDVKQIEKNLIDIQKENVNKKANSKVRVCYKRFISLIKEVSKMKERKANKIILFFIIFCFIFPVILWMIYKPPYSDWYTILASFIGGVIGGITTLIALHISTSETRKIQNENLEHSNKILKIQALNEKISDYNKFYISINPLIEYLKNLLTTIQIIYENRLPAAESSKTILDLGKYIDEIRTFSRCMHSNKRAIIDDLFNENTRLMDMLYKMIHKNIESKEKLDLLNEIIRFSNDYQMKWIEFQVEIDIEIKSFYKEKYDIYN